MTDGARPFPVSHHDLSDAEKPLSRRSWCLRSAIACRTARASETDKAFLGFGYDALTSLGYATRRGRAERSELAYSSSSVRSLGPRAQRR
jgi:hypothetical protein